MPRPRFSEMLANRRRELGLSISQASKVLKLKEQVLIAFEEGDFENIPQSGYAQGMLSSYARYLGLNPREVVDQFSEDLYEATNHASSHELRRRVRESRGLTDRVSSGSSLASDQRIFTAADEPGDTSRFSATSDAHLRTESWMSSRPSPLVDPYRDNGSAGYGSAGYRTPTGYESVSGYRAPSGAGSRAGAGYGTASGQARGYLPGQGDEARQGYPQGRPYTNRLPQSQQRQGSTRPRPSQRRRQDGPYAPSVSAPGRGAGDVYTRDVPSRYVDDLRYNDDVDAYEAASTTIGRRSSRNIASRERPRVRRDDVETERRQLQNRSRRRRPRRKGVMGALEEYFSDPRRAVITILTVLAIALILIIIFAMRACAASTQSTGRSVSVTAVTSATSEAATTTDAATTDAASTDAATTADTSAAATQAVTETDVTVSLADGEVSWVEIQCDGTSVVAETMTGPWEQSFVVTDSITIQVDNPSAVTVTENGEKVQFTSKSSGVGTVTIAGTNPDAATTDTTDTSATTDSSAG
jgi:cytoskeletal protein RodZ